GRDSPAGAPRLPSGRGAPARQCRADPASGGPGVGRVREPAATAPCLPPAEHVPSYRLATYTRRSTRWGPGRGKLIQRSPGSPAEQSRPRPTALTKPQVSGSREGGGVGYSAVS